MMNYADIHVHILFGTDDGADSEKQMQDMLDAAYADGVRFICATPHFHPGYFGDKRNEINSAFTKLEVYAKKYNDLKLCLGNELRYSPNCLEWLNSGECKTINASRYVLTDFSESADADYIVTSVLTLLNAGYIPILAHAERYESFHKDMREIRKLQECGVLIQVDAQSPFGNWGKNAKKRSRKLIEHYFADIIASDAHNLSERPPQMSGCYDYVAGKCGAGYAKKVFFDNPICIINDSDLGKELY